MKLVNDEKKAMKLSAQPNYERCTIFDENLIAVHMKKIKIYYDKPMYLGMCILDISKTFMYEFNYDYIMKKYKNKATVCYTDTDSFIYEIKTEDFYADIAGDIDSKFVTSDYSKDHPLYSDKNKKAIGYFKYECNGKQISEFVALRAKCIVI